MIQQTAQPVQTLKSKEVRPDSLPTLLPFPVGQTLAGSLLTSAIAQDRLARAYLFTGKVGVGKAMAARWLAAQILWQHRRSDAKLNRKAFVSQICSGNYPDLVWVEPTYLMNGALKPVSQVPVVQTANLIAQIRMEQAVQLRQRLQERSLGQRWVVVVDGADRLTNEAGNALLKLLEDRRDCTFILVASTLDQVLPTIRSRAQTVLFMPLSSSECRQIAVRQCPGLRECPSLLEFAAGAPGLAIMAYQRLCIISVEVRAQFCQFNPMSAAEGVLLGLRLARAVSVLPMNVQQLLLSYLQFCLWRQGDRPLTVRQFALNLIEQTIGLLNHRVQSQAVWELLLTQRAMQGTGWQIELPVDQPLDEEEEGYSFDGIDGVAEVNSRFPDLPTAPTPSVPHAAIPGSQSSEMQQMSMF